MGPVVVLPMLSTSHTSPIRSLICVTTVRRIVNTCMMGEEAAACKVAVCVFLNVDRDVVGGCG